MFYLPLGVRHCSSLKIHTASPVAWITSALDNTFWANAWRNDNKTALEMRWTHRSRTIVPPHLHGVLPFVRLAGRDVEPHLHERNLCVVVLVKLQGDFVLPGGALGHVGQRDLKRRVVVDVERQQRPWNENREHLTPNIYQALIWQHYSQMHRVGFLPENLAVPQFQPFTHMSFSASSTL